MRNNEHTDGGVASDCRDYDLKRRTKQFGLRAIRLVEALPRKMAAEVLGKQLVRSATSVGANYRAACRARSQSEFLAKMGIVEEEADESGYWMEMIADSGFLPSKRVAALIQESNELVAITVASIRTTRKRGR